MNLIGAEIARGVFVAGVWSALGVSQMAVARDGDPLNVFGSHGRAQFNYLPGNYADLNDTLNVPVVVQPDGKIVVATTEAGSSDDDFGVLRINPDGSRDTSFGPLRNGQAVIAFDNGGTNDDRVNGLAIDSRGNIVIVGAAAGGADTGLDCAVARLTPDGLPDFSFNADGRTTIGFDLGPSGSRDDRCMGVVIQRDDKILLVATAQGALLPDSTPAHRVVVARLTTNGARDSTFNGNGVVVLDFGADSPSVVGSGIAEQSDGHIVVVGQAVSKTNNENFAMARLDSNGILDPGFAQNGVSVFNPYLNGYDYGGLKGVLPLADGSVVVVGYTYPAGTASNPDYYFARIRTDGSFDPAFGESGNIAVPIDLGGGNADFGLALARDSKGRLVANGIAGTDTTISMVLMRLTANGQLDDSFGNGGVQIVSSAPPASPATTEIGGGVAIGAGDAIVATSLVTVDGTSHLEAGVVELVGDTIFSSGFTP